MTIVVLALSTVAVILTSISLFVGVKALRTPKYSAPELLRGYIKENRQIYGVCNRSIAADDIECVQVVSPK